MFPLDRESREAKARGFVADPALASPRSGYLTLPLAPFICRSWSACGTIAGRPFHETVADGDDALALLRSRFAPICVNRRPGPD